MKLNKTQTNKPMIKKAKRKKKEKKRKVNIHKMIIIYKMIENKSMMMIPRAVKLQGKNRKK